VRLVPSTAADFCNAGFVAKGTEPWLDLADLEMARFAGRFVEITYRASLLDIPARPVFRFWQRDNSVVDRIGAAPIAGAGLWVGRVPRATVRLSISPTNHPGPFGFRLEHIRRRTWATLLAQGFRRRPRQTRSALLTRLIGWKPESDNNLAWATGAIDLPFFPDWQRRRSHPRDGDGIDRARFDGSQRAPIRLVVIGARDLKALDHTLASLQQQSFGRWEARVVGVPCPASARDARIVSSELEAAVEWLGEADAGGPAGVLDAGDILPPFALALLAEQHHRMPGVRLFYGDELAAGQPVLKPGWSPRLHDAQPYVGRAAFLTELPSCSAAERRRFIVGGRLPARVGSLRPDEVQPLRRILLASPRGWPRPDPADTPRPLMSGMVPRAAIVILTRDRPDLLTRVVAGIRAMAGAIPFTIVVVDNGPPGGPATSLLATLQEDADIRLLRRPGPFSFSALCNEAAASGDEELLVFLNDDMDVLSKGWLDRLAAHAVQPTIGAVGAKLTYPDGRLQHVGVLVGMGESAGHFGALAAGDDPGWMGRNLVLHEVSAVTGACLAVTRAKFDAVGGFDAEHLPVELSDVDLCLKLNARGWQTVLDPHVHLMHEESVSRGGATLRRLDVYGSQRRVFVERWRHVLRDDPSFHPGLSLYSWTAALG